MAKEVYIDSQRNEIPINSAPTYASQMPLSPTDDTNTASAIGDLTNLTTTDKSSLVGAVNEVVSTKADKSSFAKKEANLSSVSVGANTINTVTLTVNNAVLGLVVGFYISGDAVVPMQVYFSSATQITVRVKNTASTATTCNISVFYI